jgi:hypothetical protein
MQADGRDDGNGLGGLQVVLVDDIVMISFQLHHHYYIFTA